MSRIDTMTNTAKMVTIQIGRNDTDKQLIHHSMCATGARNFGINTSVSAFSNMRRPFPTRIAVIKMLSRYFDFAKDSGKKFSVYRKSVRIGIRHFANTPFVQNLARPVERLRVLRAVFILPQMLRGGT